MQIITLLRFFSLNTISLYNSVILCYKPYHSWLEKLNAEVEHSELMKDEEVLKGSSKDHLSASHRSLSLASTGIIERGDCVEGRKIQNSTLDKAELRLRTTFQRKDGINSIVSLYPELYKQLSGLKRLKVDWNFADKRQPLPRYRFSKYGHTQNAATSILVLTVYVRTIFVTIAPDALCARIVPKSIQRI